VSRRHHLRAASCLQGDEQHPVAEFLGRFETLVGSGEDLARQFVKRL
jgi:hypothetical protein